MSLRARVALLVAVAVGVAVALAATAAYVTARHSLSRQLDASLMTRARAAAESQLRFQLGSLPAFALVAGPATRVELLTGDGTQVVAQGEASLPIGPAEIAVAERRAAQSLRTTQGFRIVAVPTSRPGFALVIGESLDELHHTVNELGLVLLIVGLAGVVVAASAGLAVARAGLAPVETLTAAAERVAATEELTPIEVRGHDELARLAEAFNAMLAALAEARERQRRLVADAGHELRTPLTSLRTNLELLAQSELPNGRPLPPEERAGLISDVRAQVEELSGLVGDLVQLARDETLPDVSPEPLDFADVVERAIHRARRRATGLRFEVDLRPWWLSGSAGELERAVTNLLDNAVKWSPWGGTIKVRLTDGELTVEDQGPGIADSDLPRVFDRFYRAAEARSLPGSGLGLAIVRQAAARHGGSVAAARAPSGGAMLTLKLPGGPQPLWGEEWAHAARDDTGDARPLHEEV